MQGYIYISFRLLGNMTQINFVGKCLLIDTEENGIKKKILVVGDLHLGYEESLNRSGVYMHHHLFEETLKYFDGVFDKVGKMDYVILLGDVKHNMGTIMSQEWNEILRLFKYLKEKCNEVVIVKGNHDGILEPIVRKEMGVRLLDFFALGEFCFIHGDKAFDEVNDKKIKNWILGHGHPAIKISDGVKIEKYKCYLVGKYGGKEIIIVPSFIEANEGSDPRENDLGMAWDFDYRKFEVFVVQDDGLEVLKFGKLKKLK